MSKKYVIEMKSEYEDTIRGIMVLGARDSNLYMDALAVEDMEELNSDYINEHFSDLQDDAYNKGYAQCQDDYSDALKHAKDTAYQRGLDDAWEAARNISMLESDGGYSWKEMKSIFGTDSASEIYVRHTAAEAINKIKAYEEKQKADDEIKVGDEVVWADTKCAVVFINRDIETSKVIDYDLLADDGSVAENISSDRFRKTGRHFDIDKILEEMKE